MGLTQIRTWSLITDCEACSQFHSYSEDEASVFNDIMKLQRNFRPFVEAAATNTGFFQLLIRKVSSSSRLDAALRILL